MMLTAGWLALAAITLPVNGQGGDPELQAETSQQDDRAARGWADLSTTSAWKASGYEEGKKLAKDRYDLIRYQMEHGVFEPHLLRQFMQGLVDGGPTKSGHRTPTVIVTLPVLGLDEQTVKNNHWVIEQILSAGVHGMMLCHARNAGGRQDVCGDCAISVRASETEGG